MKILDRYKKAYKENTLEIMSMDEYLKRLKSDPDVKANAFERMLKAIGEPNLVDTSKDPRYSRIFGNQIIRTYDVFEDFYGMEEAIDKMVAYFKHAAQGLEESRQVLYLLGPVGSAKSSLAERLKSLMQKHPVYILADKDGCRSPVFESPLGLFNAEDAKDLGVDKRYLNIRPSGWALKRLDEVKGDISQFQVIKVHPNQDRQVCISKTEPGDENNQDISTLVGKLDIRKLEFYSQNDPDAYNYSGGLCLSNQGLLEFVEMFKAPIKVLNPLLTATQEKNYKGTEAISAIPFDGIILAHSNESEWDQFKNDKTNEAFLDRIYTVEIKYCLRIEEEIKIYKKLLENSALAEAPCAPETLRSLAMFSILTRMDAVEGQKSLSKMYVYNGENVKEKDVHVKSLQEYHDLASHDEGFYGFSTRLAYKVLAEVYNYGDEVAANPVHLFKVLKDTIHRERLSPELTQTYLNIVKKFLEPEYLKKIKKTIQTAYLDSYDEYGQATFDRYIMFADHWVQDNDYRDPDTGQMFDRSVLNDELEALEKPAGIANPRDFRNEVVQFSLRYQAKHEGKNPDWKEYAKLRKVIEANMFSKTEDLLPVISFSGHKSKSAKDKHNAFIERMQEQGYTKKQVKLVVDWAMMMEKQ